MGKRSIEVILAVLLLVSIYLLSKKTAMLTASTETSQPVVVIDAGHGGADPGKVAADGCLEKDINLTIALKVRDLLEAEGIRTAMTRETDEMVHEEGEAEEKKRDMQLRCEKINTSGAVCAVSIHQNSYESAAASGAQVFYYQDSAEGQQFANLMQNALVEGLDPANTRVSKGNTSYYLLRKTSIPLIIVECGFLSNPEETKKLETEAFQEQTAQAICTGIEAYLKIGNP